jgi:hypothetical protein
MHGITPFEVYKPFRLACRIAPSQQKALTGMDQAKYTEDAS